VKVCQEITGKVERQLLQVHTYRDSPQLLQLCRHAEQLLARDHVLVTIIHGILISADTNDDNNNQSDDTHTTSNNEPEGSEQSEERESAFMTESDCESAAGSGGEASVDSAAPLSLLSSSRDGVKYSQLGVSEFVEGGKVIGQNSFKVAGQVIIGISAAFLVWDAIDLGFTITDLVRKRGSHAGRVLREKAELLESALRQTVELYSIELPE